MRGFTATGALLGRMPRFFASGICFFLLVSCLALAQVFTVGPEQIQGHYLDFHPTHVALSSAPLTHRGKQILLGTVDMNQGFAMRPLPLDRRGIVLHVNGGMKPSGESYIDELNAHGIAAKPGDRVVITDMKIEKDRIVFALNGGPDRKHRILRHISIGTNPYYTQPIVNDTGPDPVGARLTLVFPGPVPQMTAQQLEDLLAPIIGFGVKSPVEAYTDTLPPALKKAILEHHVLVGMSTEMVSYALGRPERKVRETEGQMPVEIWIYGEPPQDVEFVRINGNRVIRVELAKIGQPLVIHDQNEMGNYWSTQVDPNVQLVKLGDQDPASRAQQDQRPSAPPSLRKPGEKLPTDGDKDHPTMQPVQFPPGLGSGSQGQATPASSSPPNAPSQH